MTEKGRQVIGQICENEESRKKLTSLETIEEVLSYAKECGFELAAEDLSNETSDAVKLDSDELKTISGGGTCACVVGGGGRATREGQNVCACVTAGLGTTTFPCNYEGVGNGEEIRCVCCWGGGGKDKDANDYFNEHYN